MPERLKVVSGGETQLNPKLFQVNHPHLQPSAIVYRLLQAKFVVLYFHL